MANTARAREVAAFVAAIRNWAAARPDVEAVALAGSWVRGDARMDSDLDLVILCADPSPYLADYWWSEDLGALQFMYTREWGPLTEVRFRRPSGLEIEFGFAPISWAAINPVDEGTRAVVQDGISPLHDPLSHLARLIGAVS